MYQTTVKVVGFVTVTTEKPIEHPKNLIITLDVDEEDFEREYNNDIVVNETEIVTKQISTEVKC